MGVKEAAAKVRASGLTLTKDADEVVAMVREMASDMPDPEGGWFMADVLNAVNRMEMAEE